MSTECYGEDEDEHYFSTRNSKYIAKLERRVRDKEEEIKKLRKENLDLLNKLIAATDASSRRMLVALLRGAEVEHFVDRK